MRVIKNKFNSENDCISYDIQLLIDEAIDHFNKIRLRKRAGDERFFYTKLEVDKVLQGLNDPNSVEIIVHKDSFNNIFCYEINRTVFAQETRNFKKKKNLKENLQYEY